MKRIATVLTSSILGLLGAAHTASAAQTLRVQVDQRGDFTMIGNTLGWDCATTALPIVGTPPNAVSCGTFTLDTSPDVFWSVAHQASGPATVSSTYFIQAAAASSSAVLQVPAGAIVTNAYLYWGARSTSTAGTAAVLSRQGGFSANVTAVKSYSLPQAEGDYVYQSVADVTALVAANGNGEYRLSGIDTEAFQNRDEDVLFAAWSIVVLYRLDSEPPRNLAIFDGLDGVSPGNASNVSLGGFVVPNAGFNGKLGLIAYEGDNAYTGDSLRFGISPLSASDNLSDGVNDANNFFNGSRSYLGSPLTVVGDLPQLSGAAGTMAGLDLDVIDVTGKLKAGQTSVDLQALSTTDIFFMGAFVTSISTFRPDFVTSEKQAVDVNGGTLVPGDVLQYTVIGRNTGNDASLGTVVSDPLPANVTFVPGSINVTTGPNAGAKTDAAGDDQGTYDGASRTVTVRLGTGADATNGGSIAAGDSSAFTFNVTVNAGASGNISNQATIAASGKLGSPVTTTVTDGNGVASGTPPTVTPIGVPVTPPPPSGCTSNSDCAAPTPICDTTQIPPACIAGCTSDAQCTAGSTCNVATHICQCATPGSSCTDSDGDGLPDDVEVAAGTNPNDADSDDDGVPDGKEPDWNKDTDGDGLINALDPDSDNDGLFDGTELGYDCANPATNSKLGHCRPDADKGATTTNPLVADTDHGGVIDGSEDHNLNGAIDPGETDPTLGHGADDTSPSNTDSDGDGLSDTTETTIGSDPHDADTDNDGVPDGKEPNFSDDTDGDGLINVLDPDSDNDGLFDGTELGYDCANPATNAKLGHCRPDADKGATTTNPLVADTDHGGVIDGSEDHNLNGAIDPGETDPTLGHGADDKSNVDSDGDGLSDPTEVAIGSDPHDADTDNDGVPDGKEPNFSDDTDGDGLINVLDPDSDNDGLFDGTELGYDCANPATNAKLGHCRADADKGATKTNPLDPDTDHGGVKDGSEDHNLDGAIDPGETDPTLGHGADDKNNVDSDGDGLSDPTEVTLGSDPHDADTDNDGVPDGQEANPSDDTDGDGKINVLDPDSDGDGLFDGTETGRDCSNPATNVSLGFCTPDADKGATTTSPLEADTDHGGVSDGDEDTNHNGQIDPGERDPNNPADDKPQVTADAGTGNTGNVNDDTTDRFLAGGGCTCTTTRGESNGSGALAGLGVIGALGLALVRRRRTPRG